MGNQVFSNFDVLIEPTDAGFAARVSAPPWGEAGPQNLAVPFSPQELLFFFSRFGRTAPDATRDTKRATDAAREFGTRLFDAVFAGEIKSFYRSSAQLAANQGAGLRVRVRLKDVPELADVPWELLYDGQDFLVLSAQRALVRYLELPQAIKPLTVTPPLHALVILSSPQDHEPLDVAREWQRIQDALADVISTGLFEVELLERPTLTALQQQLRKNEYHILHFSGHGEFDAFAPGDAASALVVQDANGRGQRVGALEIARLVRDHQTMRLVVLNACEGARASTRNAFSGTAQTLMQNGMPAVIAMQFPFTDEAAQVFANTFYGALADQYPVDAALGETRKALANLPNSLEWATPVLFTRADNGNLFARATIGENALRALQRAALIRAATTALTQENFARAEELGTRLLALDARDERGRALVERAHRGRDAANWYYEGKQALDGGRYGEALAAFRNVQLNQFNYRDTVTLIANANLAIDAQREETKIPEPPGPNEIHYKNIVRELLRGRIFPFFGQKVNAFGRSSIGQWQRSQGAPSGEELAIYLATSFDYDQSDKSDLVSVSQYIRAMKGGYAELFEELHAVLTADNMPTPLHRFWAELPGQLRAHGVLPHPGDRPPPSETIAYPILFTANYDDLLERAFRDADEPFDLLIYVGKDEDRKFLHRTHEGHEELIVSPSDYPNMRLQQRATIVKVHGAIHRTHPERDSFVITEDHYLEYLRENVRDLLPQTVNWWISRGYGLFMGCNLRNWALRGLLYQLGKSDRHPWVIQPNARDVEMKYWKMLDVELLDLALEEFLPKLAARLAATDYSTGSRSQ